MLATIHKLHLPMGLTLRHRWANKIGVGSNLEKFELTKLPDYIQENIGNYKEWLD